MRPKSLPPSTGPHCADRPNRHTAGKREAHHDPTIRRRDKPLLPRRRARRCPQSHRGRGEGRDPHQILPLPRRNEGQGVRRPDGGAADRACQDAGRDQDLGPEDGGGLRGPRCRRQGRDDQGGDREHEPPPGLCRGAVQADGPRKPAVVLPAPRAKSPFSTAAGTTAR
jgi:hypothetical protein